MTAPTCETCVHWQSTNFEPSEGPPWPYIGGDPILRVGQDSAELAPGTWGWCRLVGFAGPRTGSQRFYVIDGSYYDANLSTRSDFGCVEHSTDPADVTYREDVPNGQAEA